MEGRAARGGRVSHIIVQTSVEKAPSKSIRCSEEGGGGRRSAERTFRQPQMHYLPPGVFYDFLGSHNKVRQREFRTMVLRNRSRRLLSLVGPPLAFPLPRAAVPGIVFAHRRSSRAVPRGKYGRWTPNPLRRLYSIKFPSRSLNCFEITAARP